MDTQEASGLLKGKLAEHRRLFYADLAARVGTGKHDRLLGASGAEYQVEIQFHWDDRPGGTIRVMASIDDGGLRAFLPLCDSFLMGRDGTFVGEAERSLCPCEPQPALMKEE